VGEIRLVESTGSPACDAIARGVIGAVGRAFPDRVRGCYLRGSHATGTSTAGSDLDLFIVFKEGFAGRAEVEKAYAICRSCARAAPVPLEVIVVSESDLHDGDDLVIPLNLKLATRLLHGEDIRPGLPGLRVDAWVRSVVHTPYFSYRFPAQRRRLPALTFPLRHIDPDRPFYGYDRWLGGPDGGGLAGVSGTKLLVATVCWTATAIVALRTGRYVPDKNAAVELYREHVGDQWTDLVVRTYELCRNRWQYRLPDGQADRRALRELCRRALPFQNHFLGLYRRYHLDELGSADAGRQLLAARRLGQIVFPDREVAGALERLRSSDQPELAAAVEATLDKYPAAG
jgi:hypothetical protein